LATKAAQKIFGDEGREKSGKKEREEGRQKKKEGARKIEACSAFRVARQKPRSENREAFVWEASRPAVPS